MSPRRNPISGLIKFCQVPKQPRMGPSALRHSSHPRRDDVVGRERKGKGEVKRRGRRKRDIKKKKTERENYAVNACRAAFQFWLSKREKLRETRTKAHQALSLRVAKRPTSKSLYFSRPYVHRSGSPPQTPPSHI